MKHPSHHIYAGLKDKGLGEIYLSMSLRTLALSLIMVFVPIYLYNLGYSPAEILSYYLFISLFYMIGDYGAGKLVSRFGPKHILALSFPLMVVNFVFLFSLPMYHWPLFILALSYTIPGNLFWIPYHNDFSKAKKAGKVGRELGAMKILTTSLGALGPLIGGIIAQEFGIQYTIFLTIIILAVGGIPVLKTHKITSNKKFNMKEFSVKRNWRDMIAYGGLGLEGIASTVIWPLFIFLIVGSYKKVGFITTLSLLIAIFVTVLVGKITDKYEKKKVLRFGSWISCSSGFARTIVTGVTGVYLVSTISSITQIFLQIPFFSEYYLHADRKTRTEYIVGMEMSTDIVRLSGLALLLVMTYSFDLKIVLIAGILMGALGALLTVFIGGSERQGLKEIKIHREVAKVKA